MFTLLIASKMILCDTCVNIRFHQDPLYFNFCFKNAFRPQQKTFIEEALRIEFLHIHLRQYHVVHQMFKCWANLNSIIFLLLGLR